MRGIPQIAEMSGLLFPCHGIPVQHPAKTKVACPTMKSTDERHVPVLEFQLDVIAAHSVLKGGTFSRSGSRQAKKLPRARNSSLNDVRPVGLDGRRSN
jgi:hypothetical protein